MITTLDTLAFSCVLSCFNKHADLVVDGSLLATHESSSTPFFHYTGTRIAAAGKKRLFLAWKAFVDACFTAQLPYRRVSIFLLKRVHNGSDAIL
jgi:hypothetical protein